MIKFIQFNHAQAGKIAVQQGTTCLTDLLLIGGLIKTSKTVFPDKSTSINLYQTDSAGLIFLRDRNNQIIEFLNDSITAVSVLLAANEGEIFDDQGRTIVELLGGLSELANILCGENQEVNHALLIGKAGVEK